MIIKEYSKKKKISFNNFFKFYFIISILLIISFFSIFFNTGVWTNNKNDFLNRAYKTGLNNYLHIFEITTKGFKSFFHGFEEIHIDLSYENLIVLEKNFVLPTAPEFKILFFILCSNGLGLLYNEGSKP